MKILNMRTKVLGEISPQELAIVREIAVVEPVAIIYKASNTSSFFCVTVIRKGGAQPEIPLKQFPRFFDALQFARSFDPDDIQKGGFLWYSRDGGGLYQKWVLTRPLIEFLDRIPSSEGGLKELRKACMSSIEQWTENIKKLTQNIGVKYGFRMGLDASRYDTSYNAAFVLYILDPEVCETLHISTSDYLKVKSTDFPEEYKVYFGGFSGGTEMCVFAKKYFRRFSNNVCMLPNMICEKYCPAAILNGYACTSEGRILEANSTIGPFLRSINYINDHSEIDETLVGMAKDIREWFEMVILVIGK